VVVPAPTLTLVTGLDRRHRVYTHRFGFKETGAAAEAQRKNPPRLSAA
jgi:hypothetical protein